MSKLLEVQNRITGDFDALMQPSRRLIREGNVGELSVGFMSTKVKPRKVYLCNDCLVRFCRYCCW